MALTRSFKETVKARVEVDAEFREAMLQEGVSCLLAGDMATGKAVLRDYINATVGFDRLGELMERSPETLRQMFEDAGNPQAQNLFGVIRVLQQEEGVRLEVRAVR